MLRPRLLKQGDRIAIVTPSRCIELDCLNEAVHILEEWGLHVELGKYVYAKHGYFAGTDEERLNDLQIVLDNPEVRAIFFSRGGYGMSRIVDKIDWTLFKESPKWLIGFSDITAIHLALSQFNCAGLHGIMPVQFTKEKIESSLQALKSFLFDKELPQFDEITCAADFSLDGQITGGNLSMITDSIGTATEIDTAQKILFIEEIDEYKYKLDRMLNQLSRAGKFDHLKAVMVGQMTGIKDTAISFDADWKEIVHKYFPHIPVVYDLPLGHEIPNLALPFNLRVEVTVKGSAMTVRTIDN